MEENLYKAPEAAIRDLTVEEVPGQLNYVLNLIKLAFLLAIVQTLLSFVLDPEGVMLDGEFSIIFLVTMLLLIAVIFFVIYYLCLYRPVKKAKRRAAIWLFVTALIMSLLTLYLEFVSDDPEMKVSLAENVLTAIEMLVIFYGAFLLTRPEYKVHLKN